MAKKIDSELYVYHRRFRIHRETKEIVSMTYVDSSTGKRGRLSRPKNGELEDPDLYLPKFVVGTLDKSQLDADPGFKKAITFQKKVAQENHARFQRAKAHYEWLEQFEHFDDAMGRFETWRQKNSPNNFRNDVAYLKNYVLKFFLFHKAINNPTLWMNHHNEFRDWLGEVEPVSSAINELSVGTKNNILRALHAFYKFLEHADNKGPFKRCRLFPKHEANRKDERSVIPREIADKIARDLANLEVNTGRGTRLHPHAKLLSQFFRLLLATGLRKNEALGLSLNSVFIGETRDDFRYIFEAVRGQTKPDGTPVDVFGYIYLLDQPALKSIRDKKGRVPRKPLKLKKEKAARHARLIPMMDLQVAKDLGALINNQLAALKKGTHGKDRSDYLLFDGLVYQSLNKALNQLYALKSYEGVFRYTPHDCRHTFTTEFVRLVGGNVNIVSKVLGHSREEITQDYLHLSELINKQQQIETSNSGPIDIESIGAV